MRLKHIDLDVTDYIATVFLNRPPVNALEPEIRAELVRTFDSLHDRDDVRVVILTGRGKVFCAGADIKAKVAMSREPGPISVRTVLSGMPSTASWNAPSRSSPP